MPGAGFKRDALRVRGMVQAMMDTPYQMVRAAMVRVPARVRSLLTHFDDRRRRTNGHSASAAYSVACRRVGPPGRRSPLHFSKRRMAATGRPRRKRTTLKVPRA